MNPVCIYERNVMSADVVEWKTDRTGRFELYTAPLEVYIVCQRYVDLNKGLESRRIEQVYTTKEEAEAKVESRRAKNDFNWFWIRKKVK